MLKKLMISAAVSALMVSGAFAQANPGKVLGGLAAVAIGLGLMRRR